MAITILVSPEVLRREYEEVTIIFVVYMVIYWLRNLIGDLLRASFSSTFVWAVRYSVYLGATLCLLFSMEKIVRRRSLSAAGFRFPTNRKVLLMLTGLVAFYLIGGIIAHIISETQFPYLDTYFVSVVILGPLAEEIVFRGLIQTRLAGLGTNKSLILSNMLFVLYHFLAWFLIGERIFTVYSIYHLTLVAVLGILFGYFFAETRSLLPPFLLHAVNNFSSLFRK